jgi:hypothetical protein
MDGDALFFFKVARSLETTRDFELAALSLKLAWRLEVAVELSLGGRLDVATVLKLSTELELEALLELTAVLEFLLCLELCSSLNVSRNLDLTSAEAGVAVGFSPRVSASEAVAAMVRVISRVGSDASGAASPGVAGVDGLLVDTTIATVTGTGTVTGTILVADATELTSVVTIVDLVLVDSSNSSELVGSLAVVALVLVDATVVVVVVVDLVAEVRARVSVIALSVGLAVSSVAIGVTIAWNSAEATLLTDVTAVRVAATIGGRGRSV